METSKVSFERNKEIDGIRGWAAFAVVALHFFNGVYGPLYPMFNGKTFGFIFNGPLMVSIFFLLSGDVLSIPFFAKRSSETTSRLVLSRYFRLTFPIVIGCFIIYLLMKFGLVYHTEASDIIGGEGWMGNFLQFQPTLKGVIRYSFFDVYFNHTRDTSYNPFLWTMSVEMLGSLLIFINIFIFKHIKKPLRVLWAQCLFFLLFDSSMFLFVAGMTIGYYRHLGYFDRKLAKKNNILKLLYVTLIVLFFSIFRESDATINGFQINTLIINNKFRYIWAVLLVYCIYTSKHLLPFFRSKLSVFLGEISYPIYVLHFIVMITITSWGTIYYHNNGGIQLSSVLIISTISIVISFIVSILFREVEKLYLVKLRTWVREIMK